MRPRRKLCSRKSKRSRQSNQSRRAESLRTSVRRTRFALGHYLSRVRIERLRLRDRGDRFIQLRVVLQRDVVSLVDSEYRGEHLALDLPLQPGKVLLDFGFREWNVLFAEIFPQLRDHGIVHHEFLGDFRLLTEIVADKIA